MKQKLLQVYFRFFGLLAKIYIFRHKPFIIWITGSIWKTSARMIISEILKNYLPDKKVSTSSKNFNGELWLSLSILWISDYEPKILSVLKTIFISIKIGLFWKKLYDVWVLEYGIDHLWEMDFLLSIVKPDIWMVTKIDKVHSSQFQSKEVIASEKYKLLQHTKEISFLNFSDDFSKKFENEIPSQKYFFSTDILENNKKIDLVWQNYSLKYINTSIVSNYDFYFKNEKKINITSNLIGEENVWYINIWLCILDHLFHKFYHKTFFLLSEWKLDVKFELQYSRFSIFDGIHHSILIDSSYNAAPESMKKVIENFVKVSKHIFPDYKLILCLWEMRELWEYTKIEHEKLADFTKDITQNIFVVWESMEKYFLPKSKNAQHFKNSKIMWEYLKNFLETSDEKYLILFKWSQNTIFLEESVKQVLLHDEDKNKICRQEDFWKEKKQNFFDK